MALELKLQCAAHPEYDARFIDHPECPHCKFLCDLAMAWYSVQHDQNRTTAVRLFTSVKHTGTTKP